MDNILTLDTLRIERNKPRKCTCGDRRKYSVDKVNREVTCGCGLVWDAFDALLNVAEHYEDENRDHKHMYEQKNEWIKQKPYSVLFKKLEQSYRRGEMLPNCPHCGQMFDYTEINSHTNSMFYRNRMKKDSEKL